MNHGHGQGFRYVSAINPYTQTGAPNTLVRKSGKSGPTIWVEKSVKKLTIATAFTVGCSAFASGSGLVSDDKEDLLTAFPWSP